MKGVTLAMNVQSGLWLKWAESSNSGVQFFTTEPTMLSRIIWCSGVVLALAVVGCGKKVPQVDFTNAQPRVTLFTEQYDPEQVRKAIIQAMAARDWISEGEGPEGIAARFTHKDAIVRVVISYGPDRLTIKGVDGEASSRGYEKWAEKLEATVRKVLRRTPASVPAAPAGAPPVPAPAPVAPPAPAPAPAAPAPT
jgi:hypothetical protein